MKYITHTYGNRRRLHAVKNGTSRVGIRRTRRENQALRDSGIFDGTDGGTGGSGGGGGGRRATIADMQMSGSNIPRQVSNISPITFKQKKIVDGNVDCLTKHIQRVSQLAGK